jgi:hypothetical protein
MERSPDGHSSSVVPVTIGASVGCILVGLLVGAFGIPAFRRWRGSRRHYKYRQVPIRDGPDSPQSLHEMMVTSGGGREYIVEPLQYASHIAFIILRQSRCPPPSQKQDGQSNYVARKCTLRPRSK